MEVISNETLMASIQILGVEDIDDCEIDERISKLVNEPITIRRLVDWPPEAFGLVLISYAWKVNLPKTFSAFDARRRPIEFPFECEPVFTASVAIAQEMYHNGPRELFKAVAIRSSMLRTIDNALNSGASVDGGTLSGPALIGIPAETYQLPRRPFWKRLFS
ncbi:MAG: hypothetical protein U0941_04950 [Planctomycetaceae bacterium]